MKGFDAEKLMDSLTAITIANKDFVKKKCSHLSENQLKWHQKRYSWSIQEVLSHLNANAEYYHKVLLEKIKNTKYTTPRPYFNSSPLGRSSWKSMKLGRANNIKRKFNSPKAINPTINPELIDENAVQHFIESQDELLLILEKAREVDLKKVRIPISISKIVRLRLGDALMFFIYHHERHIQQLKNILSNKNFPKK